jgi:hypothetical protein
MSPIGRIFIVLNLFLAGGFVYFSGVYLQNATDWKQKHATDTAALQTQVTDLSASVQAKESERADTERKMIASETSKNSLENENQELRSENERLARLLNTIQADLAAQQSNYATIKSSIDTATAQYTEAAQLALKAEGEKDQAVRARTVAERDLRDANDTIASLQASLAERSDKVASLEQTIKEKDVLLELVNVRYPGLLAEAMPPLSGTIERVDAAGKLVTILITDDKTNSGARPGYSFAIYSGTTYKGEALVTSVDGRFAFCRMTKNTGREVMPGDQATTITP